jgi:hypothetical protein
MVLILQKTWVMPTIFNIFNFVKAHFLKLQRNNLSPIPEIGYHSLTVIPAFFCDGYHIRNGTDMTFSMPKSAMCYPFPKLFQKVNLQSFLSSCAAKR